MFTKSGSFSQNMGMAVFKVQQLCTTPVWPYGDFFFLLIVDLCGAQVNGLAYHTSYIF